MAGRAPRGFAAMNSDKQREIARQGGRAAHAKGTAHEFTPEEAAAAGRKGGKAAHAKGTAHKWTSQEATEAGRKGGQAHGRKEQPNPESTSGAISPESASRSFISSEQGQNGHQDQGRGEPREEELAGQWSGLEHGGEGNR